MALIGTRWHSELRWHSPLVGREEERRPTRTHGTSVTNIQLNMKMNMFKSRNGKASTLRIRATKQAIVSK
jgi:hypothetical protein